MATEVVGHELNVACSAFDTLGSGIRKPVATVVGPSLDPVRHSTTSVRNPAASTPRRAYKLESRTSRTGGPGWVGLDAARTRMLQRSITSLKAVPSWVADRDGRHLLP